MSAPVQKENSNINPELDQLCINTIRALTLDAVQKAESGHPGLPLGAAPSGKPGWPDSAFWTASSVNARIVLMHS